MQLVIRQNQSSLSAPDKAKFVKAVLDLKAEKKPGNTLSTYDQYVQWHKDTVDYATGHEDAHMGPAFFAWHRVFLKRFEADLQRISGDPNLGLPYWDWRFDNSPTSSIWGPNFMGGNGNGDLDWAVTTGPFSRRSQDPSGRLNWVVRVRDSVQEPFYLTRQFGSDPDAPSLPTQQDVKDTLNATPFDVAPWDDNSESGFRNRAEGYIPQDKPKRIPQMHNRVHRWVGGSMIPITSPNDPVFWLHHCFMDKLWADWQVLQFTQGGTRDYSPYLPEEGARPGHNLLDDMSPWYKTDPPVIEFGTSPAEVLYHHKLGYKYPTDPDMQYSRPYPSADPSVGGERLLPGQTITSSNTQYNLIYESGGNLVLHYASFGGRKLWESGTDGRGGGPCKLEGNGTLVIYGPDYKTQIWASNSQGSGDAYRLVVRDDGKLAIYQSDGKQLWSVPPPPVGNPKG
jgi:hypothetical protein